MTLLTLFLSGFTSATLLPGSSEALFLLMLSHHNWDAGLLILIVGAGNSLGGMTNWVVGVFIRNGLISDNHHENKHKLRNKNFSYRKRIKTEQWIQKYGAPVLFFSFLPIVGDPLCMIAGLLRIHWLKALLFISLGKFFRYIVLSLVMN